MCKFVSKQNEKCPEQDLGAGYCFWHDPQTDKSGLNLTEKLESYVKRGGMTKGLKLQRANLTGINLVNRGNQQGYDFSESDFYRANMKGAHLFNLKLTDGSLMKANLREANLHCADLTNTNLLGVKLQEAKLDNIDVGEQLHQEITAYQHRKKGESGSAKDNYEQAEEIYRNLRKCAEEQGLFSLAGHFSYKEVTMRRFLMRKWSVQWVFSKLMDLLWGYGEKPENTIIFSLGLILLCAVLYFLFGVNYYDETLQFSTSASLSENIKTFSMAIYYSVVTFTTLGYGDITPFGVTRVFAVIEAFLGSFTIALFVVVFVKRMSR